MIVYSINKVHAPMQFTLFGGIHPMNKIFFLLLDGLSSEFSGEIKLSMDPLLHWLQYPYLLPQSDPMKQ